MKNRINDYDKFAFYYDVLTSQVDYDLWFDYLYRISGMDNGEKNAVLDLGCGTGELMEKFCSAGCSCVGVDLSEEMLALCDAALYGNGYDYFLTKGKMQDFKIQKKFDFIYSACDSVNYLSEEEFAKLLENVLSMLKNGGVFTFDMLSADFLGGADNSEIAEDADMKMYIERKMRENRLFTQIKICRGDGEEELEFVQNIFSVENLKKMFVKYEKEYIMHMHSFLSLSENESRTDKIQVVVKRIEKKLK